MRQYEPAPAFAEEVRRYVRQLASATQPISWGYEHSALLFLRSLAPLDVAERHAGWTTEETWPEWGRLQSSWNMQQDSFTPKLVKTTRRETDKDRFEQLMGLSSGDRWETTVIVDASEASLLGWALEVETSPGIHRVPLHPGTHVAKRGEPFKLVWGATLQHTRPASPVRLISPAGIAWEVTDGIHVPTVHGGTVQEVVRINQVGINHLPTIVEHLAIDELDISELLALCGRQRITDTALKVIDAQLARRGLTTYPALTKEPRSYLIFHNDGLIAQIFAAVLEPTDAGDEFLETGIGIDLLWDAHNYADPLNYLAKLSGHTRPHFDMALDDYLHNDYVNTGGWRSGEQSLRPEGWSTGWVLEFPTTVSTLNDQIDWLGRFGHAVEITENTMKSIDNSYGVTREYWEGGVLTHVWENDNFIINPKERRSRVPRPHIQTQNGSSQSRV